MAGSAAFDRNCNSYLLERHTKRRTQLALTHSTGLNLTRTGYSSINACGARWKAIGTP